MYNINLENTGLETFDQVEKMAKLMNDAGYNVEATRNSGLINPDEECPCNDSEWMDFLCDAAEA